VQAEQVDLRAVARMHAEPPADVDRRARGAEDAESLDVVPDHRDDRPGPVGQRQT
jgi:hypothetical protein